MASSPPKPKRLRRSQSYSQPRAPHGELLVDEILTHLPVAAAVRFRAVCRDWNAALTSDHFIRAHHVRAAAAAARNPELLFLAPSGAGGRRATSFYACSIREGEAPPAAAHELLTVADVSAEHAVFSPTPCRGLTLVFDARASEYHVFNLSTGDHVVLPPCQPAAGVVPLESDESIWPGIPINPTSYLPPLTPPPLELSTTGIGFDDATGEHKVVRLFKKRNGEYACEVCNPRGLTGWRRCVGRPPPCVSSFIPALPPVFVDGYLYWLLDDEPAIQQHRILSFSMATEQFGWVYVPPRLSHRICYLANLDDFLCAVFDNRIFAGVYGLFTWSGRLSSPSPSWSVRCCINLKSLQPQQVSSELAKERAVVPLCSAARGKKILLATGRHKVFAYDVERDTVERVFRMQDFVDVPRSYLQAPLLLSVGLHENQRSKAPEAN